MLQQEATVFYTLDLLRISILFLRVLISDPRLSIDEVILTRHCSMAWRVVLTSEDDLSAETLIEAAWSKEPILEHSKDVSMFLLKEQHIHLKSRFPSHENIVHG